MCWFTVVVCDGWICGTMWVNWFVFTYCWVGYTTGGSTFGGNAGILLFPFLLLDSLYSNNLCRIRGTCTNENTYFSYLYLFLNTSKNKTGYGIPKNRKTNNGWYNDCKK